MSTFFLYCNDQNSLDSNTVNSVSSLISHYPWLKVSYYHSGKLQLIYAAVKNNQTKIFHHEAKQLTFILYGYIVESSDGLSTIDESSEEKSLQQQIIHRYVEKGISACTGLNGMYHIMVWNHQTSTLEIASDRLGLIQIFYIPLENKKFAITTDISTVKAIPNYQIKINKRGIFDLLYMGFAFESRTVLEDVHRLLPNSSYTITEGNLSLKKTSRLPFAKNRWGSSTSKLLNELEFYYVQAIKRQLSPEQNILFFMSGGKDSRILSYFLKQAEIIPHCLTFGENHHAESFFAKNVCKVLNFPWRRMPISQNFYANYALETLKLDSFSSRTHSPTKMEVLNNLSREWDYIISTYLGDIVFGNTIKKCKLENGRENDPMHIFLNYFKDLRSTCFSEEDLCGLFPKESRDLIREYQKEAFELFAQLADEPFQMALAYQLRSDGRFKIGCPLKTINAGSAIRLPCIDNDLMAFAFSLPPSMLYNRMILDIFLMNRAENIGSIPLEQFWSYFRPLVASNKSQLKTFLWQIFSEKIKLPFLKLLNPVSATLIYYHQVFSLEDKGFRAIKNEALSDISSLEGIININKARKVFKMPISKEKDVVFAGDSLRSLISVILAIKYFR